MGSTWAPAEGGRGAIAPPPWILSQHFKMDYTQYEWVALAPLRQYLRQGTPIQIYKNIPKWQINQKITNVLNNNAIFGKKKGGSTHRPPIVCIYPDFATLSELISCGITNPAPALQ